jgi:hypothetical protein
VLLGIDPTTVRLGRLSVRLLTHAFPLYFARGKRLLILTFLALLHASSDLGSRLGDGRQARFTPLKLLRNRHGVRHFVRIGSLSLNVRVFRACSSS